MFVLGRLQRQRIDRVLAASRRAAPTYEPVGGTRSEEWPDGYPRHEHRGVLGTAPDVWDRAVDGVRRWVPHAGAGATVFPPDCPPVEGETVVVVTRVGPLHIVAPCRVVYVIDEPARYGFAYGTLPHHPEAGEESFVVEAEPDGAVTFTVASFSRPQELIARAGGPVTRMMQRHFTKAYVEALHRHVAG